MVHGEIIVPEVASDTMLTTYFGNFLSPVVLIMILAGVLLTLLTCIGCIIHHCCPNCLNNFRHAYGERKSSKCSKRSCSSKKSSFNSQNIPLVIVMDENNMLVEQTDNDRKFSKGHVNANNNFTDQIMLNISE